MGRVGEGLNIEFVISAGDNFYDSGLTGVDDIQFDESFRNIYTAPSLQTTWYTSKCSYPGGVSFTSMMRPANGRESCLAVCCILQSWATMTIWVTSSHSWTKH